MALDFPNSPTVGQVYGSYQWDGEKWASASAGPQELSSVVVNVPIATLEKGIVVNQQPAGTLSVSPVATYGVELSNGTFIRNWNIHDTTNVGINPGTAFGGDGCQVIVNGANAFAPNGMFALFGDCVVEQIAPTPGGNHYIGVMGRAIAKGNAFGSGQSISGINSNVAIDGGITGWVHAMSLEADMTVIAGATIQAKYGIGIVLGPNDAVQGSLEDAGLAFYNHPAIAATSGWKYGIKFDQASRATRVLSDDGVLIGVSGAQTAAKGIDLVGWTFTDTAFKSNGFSVANNGSVGATHLNIVENVNAATQILIENTLNSANAAASLTYKVAAAADALVMTGLFNQGGNPDFYFDAAPGVNTIHFRMNGTDRMLLKKAGTAVEFLTDILVTKPGIPKLTLNDEVGNNTPTINFSHGVTHWAIWGGAANADTSYWFYINRHNNAGVQLDSPLYIRGLDGAVFMPNDVLIGKTVKLDGTTPVLTLNQQGAVTPTRTTQIKFSQNSVMRWHISSLFDAEGGANSGSNFEIARYDDAGAVIAGAPVLTLNRANASATFGGNIITTGAVNPATITTTGNVGIGVAPGTRRLKIQGGTANTGEGIDLANGSGTILGALRQNSTGDIITLEKTAGAGALVISSSAALNLTGTALGFTGAATFSATVQATGFNVGANAVVGARNTGWLAMTGTTDKNTAFATGTVTLPQLAGRVMALQAALTTHGLIGT